MQQGATFVRKNNQNFRAKQALFLDEQLIQVLGSEFWIPDGGEEKGDGVEIEAFLALIQPKSL